MQATDTTTDSLTRIHSVDAAEHDPIEVPRSNMKKSTIKVLVREGYVKNYTVIEDDGQGVLKVNLKYDEGKAPVVKGLCRVSKPGLRVYSNAENLSRVLRGLGIVVISTSRGIMTDRWAHKGNVGGEILASIW